MTDLTELTVAAIRDGVANCGVLRWRTDEKSGPAIFSLRPEAISLVSDSEQAPGSVPFRGTLQQQLYAGSSELLEVKCGHEQILRVRIPASGPLSGEQEFFFSPSDVIRVRE